MKRAVVYAAGNTQTVSEPVTVEALTIELVTINLPRHYPNTQYIAVVTVEDQTSVGQVGLELLRIVDKTIDTVVAAVFNSAAVQKSGTIHVLTG